jgi:putative endonuclease
MQRRVHLGLAAAGHHWSMSLRRQKGSRAHARGLAAESSACAALVRDGWTVLQRRVRTEAGEVDVLAEKDGLLAIIEVKARPTLADAAAALTSRQRARLLGAADIVLAAHPGWGVNGVRFDLLVVDAAGSVRRIADAFRLEG